MSPLPPFSTATLARLYLSQGHLDAAQAIAAELTDEDAASVHQALRAATDRRVAYLTVLLQQLRDRRRVG